MSIIDWIIFIMNPATSAIIVWVLIKRRDLVPGIPWLTRLALAVLGGGLMVQWLIAYSHLVHEPLEFASYLWVLKDFGLFLLFFSMLILFNVRKPEDTTTH